MRMVTKRGRQLSFIGEFDLIYSVNTDGLYKAFTQQTFVAGPCLSAGGSIVKQARSDSWEQGCFSVEAYRHCNHKNQL